MNFLWAHTNKLNAYLKLVSAIFYFFTKWLPIKNYEKCFLFYLKNSFHSLDIQIFVFFPPAFNTFQIQKSKWKWNILWCHEWAWTYRPSQIPRKEKTLRVHKNSCKVLIPLCKNNSNLPMCSFFFSCQVLGCLLLSFTVLSWFLHRCAVLTFCLFVFTETNF